VCPELAGCANARLHFVYDHQDVVFLGQSAQAAEEGGRGVVVAAFGLDWLDDYGTGREMVRGDDPLDVSEGFSFNAGVFFDMVFEGVFKEGEGGLWPVESGDVELVDRLGACGGKGTEEPAMEGGLEGQDGELWCARGLVQHARCHVLFSELDVGSSSLLLAAPHKGCLICGFVCV
jgi:hypothetical protein